MKYPVKNGFDAMKSDTIRVLIEALYLDLAQNSDIEHIAEIDRAIILCLQELKKREGHLTNEDLAIGFAECWTIVVDGGYGAFVFEGTVGQAEVARAAKSNHEQAVATMRRATPAEIKREQKRVMRK